MRLNLYSQFVTLLTLSCHSELTSLVHSLKLEQTAYDFDYDNYM